MSLSKWADVIKQMADVTEFLAGPTERLEGVTELLVRVISNWKVSPMAYHKLLLDLAIAQHLRTKINYKTLTYSFGKMP